MAWKFDHMLSEEDKKQTRKRVTYAEDNLERWCVRWFDIQYPKLRMLMHHSPNEGKRSVKEGARNKSLGTRRGFPDLIFLLSGGEKKRYSFLAIELKTERGRQTEEQKAFQHACESLTDGLYVVIRSVDMFKMCVDDYINERSMERWMKKE